jgi:seryl-tRNA(Sec) selenium transferase
VVNNCAAAGLILRHFTRAKPEVIISRGELVQIGGGFRIPEILEASGAKLREIGATNKTSLADYAKAISRETAMILKVHRSNFFMGGFVEFSLDRRNCRACAQEANSVRRRSGQRRCDCNRKTGRNRTRAHPHRSPEAGR